MHVLLLIPTHSYRVADFMTAAEAGGIKVIICTDKALTAKQLSDGGTLQVDFSDPETGLRQIVDHCAKYPVDGVVGVDDATQLLAAKAAGALGLTGNDVKAVAKAVNKLEFRRALQDTGIPVPEFKHIPAGTPVEDAITGLPYPCVLKPTGNSASRGVIRANHEAEAVAAIIRIQEILAAPGADGELAKDRDIIAEGFIPGAEFALEGILENGRLITLAIFEKPDPLDGPYFEESIYVTPPRITKEHQAHMQRAAESAAQALGLTEGPVHAELRYNLAAPEGNNIGPQLIELAPRTIGGHCGRSLTFTSGQSLEEIVLRHALGLEIQTEATARASGVMMIPIPRKGTLRAVDGLDTARAVGNITEVTISIPIGSAVVPLPEGFRYLGFIFAQAPDADAVEGALRRAHKVLEFHIA